MRAYGTDSDPGVGCEHEWQPISFRFESQMLDAAGRVLIRQPDLEEGRVYCVCMKCHTHTYIVTEFVGYYHVLDRHLNDEGNDIRALAKAASME